PDDVAEFEIGGEPAQPPAVAVRCVRRPIVERVAPKLPVGGAAVRRHASDEARVSGLFVEQEEFGICPDVGTVAGNEDRCVADELDAGRGGFPANLAPLSK